MTSTKRQLRSLGALQSTRLSPDHAPQSTSWFTMARCRSRGVPPTPPLYTKAMKAGRKVNVIAILERMRRSAWVSRGFK